MQVERIPAVERPRPQERVPLEMILVLVWTGMPAFRSLVALQGQVMILGWATLNGTSAIGYTLLETFVVGACYYGILGRWAWARPLTIGWSLYGFVLSAINPLALLFYRALPMYVLGKLPGYSPPDQSVRDAVTVMVGWHLLLMLAITAAVVGYLYRARDFFRA